MAALDVVDLETIRLAIEAPADREPELGVMLSAVSARFDEVFGAMVRRTLTETHRTRGYRTVYLQRWPIDPDTITVELTERSGRTLTSYGTATVTTVLADVDAAWGKITHPMDRWPDSKFDNLEVTYTAGRWADTAAVEADTTGLGAAVIEGVTETCRNLWPTMRFNSDSVGEYEFPTVQFPRFTIPNSVKEQLDYLMRGEIPVG
jgi:hypothetical protein